MKDRRNYPVIGAPGLRWPGLSATVAALTLAAAPAGAQTRELRFAFGLPDIYAAYKSLETFAATITEAGVPAKVYAMSLFSLAESSDGLRDGIADIAWVTMPYKPAEFSETILMANLSMLTTTGDTVPVPGAAMTGASLEYTLLNCPDCLAQFKAQNQVYTAGSSSPPYVLMCNKTIATVEALKGKRIRSGAGNFTRWAEYFGASGVSLPGNEIYDALGRGTVDCTANAMADITGNRYIDVTKSVTLGVPGGVFSGLAVANFNRDIWLGLSVEQRTAIMKAAARLSAESVVAFNAFDVDGTEQTRAKGIEIIDAPPELMEATATFVEEDVKAIVEEMGTKYGVPNAEEKVATARALIEKWKGLTRDIGDDPDALEKVYWDEVYSKLDLATYGMD